MLHSHFSLKHELNEWFNLELDDIINFNKTCDKLTETIKALLNNPFFTKNLK